MNLKSYDCAGDMGRTNLLVKKGPLPYTFSYIFLRNGPPISGCAKLNLTGLLSSAIMLCMTKFIPGLELSRLFYEEAVRPVIDRHFPEVLHSAALLGHGSEVLGFDTPQSTDHHWGPRLQLFLCEEDYPRHSPDIKKVLSNELPPRFMGYSTHFTEPDEEGVQHMKEIESGPINHRVVTYTVRSFFESILHFNPYDEIGVLDWLTFPQQELLSITRGEVFFDGLNELNRVRDKFRYYPKDVWLYLVASQWMKISQEEAFVGRCGEIGDEVGSQIIAARLVRELIRLCFLLEKTYIPYGKWLGTAFAQLQSSKQLRPIFIRVLHSTTWNEREKWLSRACEIAGNLHNSLGITRHVEAEVSYYHNRPYLVIHAERFAKATRDAIEDENVNAIKVIIGSIDQFVDSTDLLSNPQLFRLSKVLFE